MRNINFCEEKKWIMAYLFKRKKNITVKQLFHQWNCWWNLDFASEDDEQFIETHQWVKDTINSHTFKQLKEKRLEKAGIRADMQVLNKLAKKKGYYIKFSTAKNHPLKVSGYAIFTYDAAAKKYKMSKNPVYGKHWELTLQEVENFLKNKPEVIKEVLGY